MTKQAELIDAVLNAPAERRAAIMLAARGTDSGVRSGTRKEAAEIGKCHPRTIQRYGQEGKLRVIRISPRRIRYDLNEVERLFSGLTE